MFLGHRTSQRCSRALAMWDARAVARFAGTRGWLLKQTELASTCDGFGAPLDLEFRKDAQIVPLHGTQGEKQPLANLLI